MNKEEVTLVELLPKIYRHINVAVSSAFMSALEQFKKGNAQKSSYAEEDFLSAEQTASFLAMFILDYEAKPHLPFRKLSLHRMSSNNHGLNLPKLYRNLVLNELQ